MMEDKCVKVFNLQYLKRFKRFTGLKLLKFHDGDRLCVWNKNYICVLEFPTTLEKPKVVKLLDTTEVMHIIQRNCNFLIILDNRGTLYLQSSECNEFIQPQQVLTQVLAACVMSEEGLICVLHNTGEDLEVQMHLLTPTGLQQQSKVVIGVKSCMDLIGCCNVYCLNSGSLSPDLQKHLFRVQHRENLNLVVITLGSGKVLCIPFLKNFLIHDPCLIYSSYSRVVALVKDDAPQSKEIYLFLENNTFVIMRSTDSNLICETRHSAGNKVVCQASLRSVFLSDTNHCWHLKLAQKPFVESVLPVRGVIAASQYEDDIIIAATRHGSIYFIDLSLAPEHEDINFEPEYIFKNVDILSKKVTSLDSLITKEDFLLEAISLIKHFSNFKSKFVISVKVYEVCHPHYNLLVKVENKSGVSFPANFWYLQTIIEGNQVSVSEYQCLLKTFNDNDTILIKIQCCLEELSIPLHLTCKLISVPNFTKFEEDKNRSWFILPIGSVVLDAVYFISPMTSLPNVQDYSHSIEGAPCRMYTYHIQLSEDKNLEDIVDIFTQVCSHKVGALRNNKYFTFSVLGARVEFQTRSGKTFISCSSVAILMQINDYLKKQLSKTSLSTTVSFAPLIPLHIENIKLAIEFAKIRRCLVPNDVEEFHKTLRESVTLCLPASSCVT